MDMGEQMNVEVVSCLFAPILSISTDKPRGTYAYGVLFKNIQHRLEFARHIRADEISNVWFVFYVDTKC